MNKSITTIIKVILFSAIVTICTYFMWDSIQHIRAEINYRNGYIKLAKKYPKLAIHNFQEAKRLAPWELHYQLQLAKAYESAAKKATKNISEFTKFMNLAIGEYLNLINKDPMNPWYQARLGLIYHDVYNKNKSNKNYQALAIKHSKKATEIDKSNPLFSMHYGHLLMNYKKNDLAEAYYLKSLSQDPDLIEIHFNLANIYNQKNDQNKRFYHYQKTAELLVKLEEKNNNNPTPENKQKIASFQNARIFLAQNYLNNKQFKQALYLIDQIPTSVEKLQLLASLFEQTNKPVDALQIYNVLKENLNTTDYDDKIKQLSQ